MLRQREGERERKNNKNYPFEELTIDKSNEKRFERGISFFFRIYLLNILTL
jgi:hypothetical protein